MSEQPKVRVGFPPGTMDGASAAQIWNAAVIRHSEADVPAHGILSAPPPGEADTDEPANDEPDYSQFSTRRDAKLAAKLVANRVAAERERCAGVAEARVCGKGHRIDAETEAHNLACECIAATIREGK